MHSYFKIPLSFFFVATTLGLLLRWHNISTLETFHYPYLLHAHSHIMFLGWVFNALYLAYVYNFAKSKWDTRYRAIFMILQVLVLAMLISFPLQGYGLFSIVSSTLHTAMAVVFIIRFIRDLKQIPSDETISLRLVKISLVFFLISGIGPVALGFVAANGSGQSNWYSFAAYFYLHFQYDGFFLFGALGLLFKLLEDKRVPVQQSMAIRAVNLMAAACVPAYLLSVLWASPGLIFNITGLVAAIVQIVSLIFLVKVFHGCRKQIIAAFNGFSVSLLGVVAAALITKTGLQLLSAFPQIARLTLEYRAYVIAYLHLVLVGIITLFLIVWYREYELVNPRASKPGILLFIAGLTGMELLLIVSPSWRILTGYPLDALEKAVFAFSTLLWTGSGWLICTTSGIKKRLQKVT